MINVLQIRICRCVMETKKVTIFSKDYKEIKRLQQSAFPSDELYPMWSLHLLALQKHVHYVSFHEDNAFCGLMYYSVSNHLVYVFYVAVNDKIRSKGVGTKIFEWLKIKYPNKEITLNVEPLDETADNTEQRTRRIKFYEKQGFHDSGYMLKDMSGEFDILTTSDSLAVLDYRKAILNLGMGFYKPQIVKK